MNAKTIRYVKILGKILMPLAFRPWVYSRKVL